MKTRILFQWANALALLTAATVCHADTKPIPLKPGQTLCKRELLVPIPAPIKNDGSDGVEVKMLQAIARDYHCKMNFFVAPAARMELMYLNGKSDLLMLDIQIPAFESVGTFVPISKGHLGFIMLRTDGMPTSAEQILTNRELRVHYMRATTPGSFSGYGKEADELLSLLTKDDRLGSFKDLEEGIKKLRAKHIDVMFGEPPFVPAIQKMDKTLDPVYIPTNLTLVLGWYVSNKTAPGIDRALLAQLIYKYSRSFDSLKNNNVGITNPKYFYTWMEPPAQ